MIIEKMLKKKARFRNVDEKSTWRELVITEMEDIKNKNNLIKLSRDIKSMWKIDVEEDLTVQEKIMRFKKKMRKEKIN